MCRTYKNGQLAYYKEKADQGFWEDHWKTYDLKEGLKKENQFVRETLCQYNSQGSVVFEGGCGSCSFLYPMHHMGYKAMGVDYTEKTLRSVKQIAPELILCAGDLTNLSFKKNSFDAYWSIGVIEHFEGGYEKILNECSRILRTGGIAYISFPYMNMLRKVKGKFGLYDNKVPDGMEFYQYALDYKTVKNQWKNHGFEFLDKFYMFPHHKYRFLKNKILNLLMDPWHHHSIMLVFRKIR